MLIHLGTVNNLLTALRVVKRTVERNPSGLTEYNKCICRLIPLILRPSLQAESAVSLFCRTSTYWSLFSGDGLYPVPDDTAPHNIGQLWEGQQLQHRLALISHTEELLVPFTLSSYLHIYDLLSCLVLREDKLEAVRDLSQGMHRLGFTDSAVQLFYGQYSKFSDDEGFLEGLKKAVHSCIKKNGKDPELTINFYWG